MTPQQTAENLAMKAAEADRNNCKCETCRLENNRMAAIILSTIPLVELLEVAELLRMAKCPDGNCNGNGSTWFTSMSPLGEPEQIQQQCQWCDEKQSTLTNLDAKLNEKGQL